MRPTSARFLRDTVEVYPAADGRDDDAGPARGRGEPTTLACAVQRTTSTSAESRRVTRHDGVEFEADYNLLFAARPPVPDVEVDLRWTHAGGDGTPGSGTPLDPPVWLLSIGAAEPPGGISARWTVAARRNQG